MKKKQESKEKLVRTTDNFCPNFNSFGNTDGDRKTLRYVLVSLRCITPPWEREKGKTWRVAVWGADDLGYTKDFTKYLGGYNKANELYLSLKPPITMRNLETLNFEPF